MIYALRIILVTSSNKLSIEGKNIKKKSHHVTIGFFRTF